MSRPFAFTEEASARFWSRVNKGGPTATHVAGLGPCWIWTGGLDGYGYGRMQVGGRAGITLRAHRASYEIHHGEIPEGMCVLHKCDERRCLNPGHLRLGTRPDNTRDMMAKGRHRCGFGERSGRSRLTEADVLSIRAQYETGGVTQWELSRRFNTARSNISAVVTGATWRHV